MSSPAPSASAPRGALVSAAFLSGLPAIALALCYPFALLGFRGAADGALHSPGGGPGLWAIAVACMLAACAVPLLALWRAMRLATTGGAPYARRVTLLAVAAPPICTLLPSLLPAAVPDTRAWVALWCLLAVAGLAARGTSPRTPPLTHRPAPGSATLRTVHAAVLIGSLIAMFVLFHVGNQLTGLAGPDSYDQLMKLGRVVYRSSFIEPLLVTLIFVQLLSGLYLLWRDAAGPQDRLRTLQLASGCYLIFFLLSHLNATLLFGRRVLHGDTGWAFATGGPGGLVHAERLVPYYGFAVIFALLHLALGVRRLLLRSHVRRVRADAFVVTIGVLGAVIALAILAGMFGARLPRG
jgi:hypothetical protein